MIQITLKQMATLQDWFVPERPHLLAWHMFNTGNGACFVDRWPRPRVVLVSIAGFYSLRGDPDALTGEDLTRHLGRIVYTSERFVPLLEAAFSGIRAIDRVVLTLEGTPQFDVPPGVVVRPLQAGDAAHLEGLSPGIGWISNSWGGPDGLAASGYAWGAFSQGTLASAACSFLVGDASEDLGIVTEAAHRGRGLAGACVGPLCQDVQRRGRRPTWTTDSDNEASLHVAEKLGFKVQGQEKLYVLSRPAPAAEEK